ncbi:4'-phosphopantetheinyl transferase family protein [Streptomyces sp. NPDC002577]
MDQPPEPWWRFLDPAERRRAWRLPTPELRRRFIVRRGLLRTILAGQLGHPPGEARTLRIATEAGGRPHLSEHPGTAFSSAHTGPLGVLVVTRAGQVGVDIEQIRPARVTPRMLAYTLTPAEHEQLSRLNPPERVAAFHDVWTAKEAVAKATGHGLARCFTGVEIQLHPPGPDTARTVDAPARAWTIHRLTAPGYRTTAALVVDPAFPAPSAVTR